MPVFGLPTGPTRLRINNETGNKTIVKVKATSEPVGAQPLSHEEAVAIPPDESQLFGPEEPIKYTSYEVEVTWTDDWTTLHTVSSVCTDTEGGGTIRTIDAYLCDTVEEPVLELWIREAAQPSFLCLCP